MITYVVLGLVVLIVLWAISTYNGLVSRRAMVAEGWSGIDAQLKRRADLIPNLVETV
jgi:LemA protein